MSAFPTLATIPFDVFYIVATFLDDSDYVHLSHTSRTIYALLNDDLIARRIVEVRAAAAGQTPTWVENVLS